jgi:hypothetical protein
MKKSILIATLLVFGFCPIVRAGNFSSWALNIKRAQDNKRPTFVKLDKDSASTHKHVNKLALRYARTSHDLTNLNMYLAFPASLAKSLRAIEASLKLVKSGAKTAQAFPDLRTKAKKLEKSSTASLAQITPARKKAEKIAKKMEPARKTVEKAAKGLKTAGTVLSNFDIHVLMSEPDATTLTQYAINHYPKTASACVAKKADVAAKDLDKLAIELDRVAKLLLYKPEIPGITAFEKLEDAMDIVRDLIHEANKLEDRLYALTKPLKELDKFLDKSFSVKLPYLNPLPKTYKISISAKVILRGSAAIQNEMEKILSRFFWKIAKVFGLNKLIKSIVHASERALHKITNKLNLDTNVNFPGMDRFDKAEAEINKLLAKIPSSVPVPNINIKSPSFGMPGVKAGYDFTKMENLIKGFVSPYGLNWRTIWPVIQVNPPTLGCK